MDFRELRPCRLGLSIFALLAGLLASTPTIAQTSAPSSDPQVDTGIHSYGSYDGVHDSISLSSGNLSFCIPLVNLPGPNNRNLTIPLCYNSAFMERDSASQQSNIVATVAYFPWVWGAHTATMGPGWALTGRPAYYGSGQTTGTGLAAVFMPDGSKFGYATCGTQGNVACGPDGEMADTYLQQGTSFGNFGYWVYLKDGSIARNIDTSNVVVSDPNGNHFTYSSSSVVDTLGRTVNVAASDAAGDTPASISFQYPDPSGMNPTVTVTVQVTTTNFVCNQSQGQFGVQGPYSMPSAVILPNGQSYTFQYNSCGLLTKITYPAGGYTRYDYALQSFLNQSTTTGYVGIPVNEVAHKYVCPAAGGANSCSVPEQVTTYLPVVNSNDFNNSQMTVTDPLGNRTVYQFAQSLPGLFSGLQGVETNRSLYDASGKFLKSIQTQYANTTSTGCNGQYDITLPTVQTTTLDNGMTSQIQWDYDCHYPATNDSVMTEERDYDFAQGAPGALIKRVDYTWLHRDNPNVYGRPQVNASNVNTGGANILNRKTSETVYDGSGTLVAQTKYVYDNNNPTNPSNGAQGNLTSVSRWRSTDNSWLTTQYQYGAFGNKISEQDPNGNVTTYSYADNYSDSVNRNSNAYLTKTTYPNGAVTQTQYYWGGGRVAAVCGENFVGTCKTGLTSAADYETYSYDVMGRRVTAVAGDGGSTTTCFSDTPGSTCASSTLPMKVFATEAIASGVNKSSVVVLDGEGRKIQTQLTSDSSCAGGTVNVDTSYDADGRVSTVSNPYCSNASSASTSGTTTYTYDGLGRKTQVSYPDGSTASNAYTGRAVLTADEGRGNGTARTQRITQMDALGRLKSVCEVTSSIENGSSGTPASCGLDIGGTGFITQYAYDGLGNLTSAQQGNISRTFTYDSLSELKSATNPESGTTTYGYDNDGNVTSKTTATGITTTYGYDKLNRLTSKTYSDNATPTACFSYDQSGVNGIGKLTAEWTQTGTCATTAPSTGALTERFAAYDLMGRVTTDSQCASPGSCSANSTHGVSYGYDLAGDISSSTDGLGMTFTSVYDSAGRLSTLAGPQTAGSSSRSTLFQATTYTPASAIQDASIGSGIAFHRDYNNRLLPTDEIDKVTTSPGSAIVQLSGTDQVYGFSTGSITFSGTEQSTVSNGQTGYDGGLFLISINNGQPFQLTYGQYSTPQTLAASVASSFTCSSGPVQAAAVGATVYFLSCQAGSNTNYAISVRNDGSTFPQPSFSATASGATMALAGPSTFSPNAPLSFVNFVGVEQSTTQNGTTTYDSGSFTVLFYNSPATGGPVKVVTISWGQGSTSQTLASALVSSLTPCSSGGLIAATLNGSSVTLGSCTAGQNYLVSVNLGHGSGTPSFSVEAGNAFVTGDGNYDAGTVNLLINGTQVASAAYSSASSTSAIVSALVASNGSNSPVTLSANGTNLAITAKNPANNSASYSFTYTYDSTHFSHTSFSSSSSSGTLVGSQNSPLYNWTINSYAPNGDVLSMTDSVMGTWQYSYDDMNRLVTASATAGTMSSLNLSWDYDRYGNRWDQNATGSGSAVQTHFTFTGNNNRMNGYTYDADGNLLNDGTHTYTYDAENRIITINGQKTYIYDATGARVAKLGSGGSVTAVYVLGAGGQQIAELNGSGVWQHSNVYTAGGRLLATYTASTNLYHYNLTDWLSTKRMQTNASGNQEEICVSYPFGDGLTCSGATDATEQHFTGKDRDAESGLDYFGARYLSSNFGRFMTPDWAAAPADVPYAKFGDPQSLNLYAYVGDNPNTGVDVDGHDLSALPTSNPAGGGYPEYAGESFSIPDPDAGQNAQGGTPAANSGSAGAPATPAPAVPTTGQAQKHTPPAGTHYQYDIKTGNLYLVDGKGNATFVGHGYSGKGAGKDNPNMQDVKGAKDKPDAGPIPAGTYTIGPIHNSPSTGKGTMNLDPDASNNMHGRDLFRMHGDSSQHPGEASDGCIVMPRNVRDTVSGSGIHTLEVQP